jgi:hypothetical protein
MSQALTMNKVLESLQRTLHDLADLHMKAGRPFDGITISALPFTYRDYGVSLWDITFAPHSPVPEVEEIPLDEDDADEPEDDEDITLEEAFVEGFTEGRQE